MNVKEFKVDETVYLQEVGISCEYGDVMEQTFSFGRIKKGTVYAVGRKYVTAGVDDDEYCRTYRFGRMDEWPDCNITFYSVDSCYETWRLFKRAEDVPTNGKAVLAIDPSLYGDDRFF